MQNEEASPNPADETPNMSSDGAVNASSELRKRRSTRIVQAVPLVVTGVDALGRPFAERTSTLILNCHGCRYPIPGSLHGGSGEKWHGFRGRGPCGNCSRWLWSWIFREMRGEFNFRLMTGSRSRKMDLSFRMPWRRQI